MGSLCVEHQLFLVSFLRQPGTSNARTWKESSTVFILFLMLAWTFSPSGPKAMCLRGLKSIPLSLVSQHQCLSFRMLCGLIADQSFYLPTPLPRQIQFIARQYISLLRISAYFMVNLIRSLQLTSAVTWLVLQINSPNG